MWPWEHLAVGYLSYSAYVRLRYGRPPADRPVAALVVATQVPDLVDKPLAWSVDVLPAGRSLGHSLFTAVLVIGLAALVARRLDQPAIPMAVAVGYVTHLLGDVAYPLLLGEHPGLGFLLWPLASGAPTEGTPGLSAEVLRHLGSFYTFLLTPRGGLYLLLEGALLLGLLLLWRRDGFPGRYVSR